MSTRLPDRITDRFKDVPVPILEANIKDPEAYGELVRRRINHRIGVALAEGRAAKRAKERKEKAK